MKTNIILLLSTLALVVGCTRNSSAPTDPVEGNGTSVALLARGKQLVSIGGCSDCHTPMKFDPQLGMPVPDMSRFLSGHPEGAPAPSSTLSGQDQAVIGPTFTSFKAPFGVVYSPNITSDIETGVGGWTDEMFLKAMRTGRHYGGNGRPILPPMPWATLGQQSDDDLRAILAYLKSVKPVSNVVPSPDVPLEVMDGIAVSYDKMLKGHGEAARP